MAPGPSGAIPQVGVVLRDSFRQSSALIYRLVGNWSPLTVNKHFRWLQLVSVSFMSFTHGTSDAQQARGIVTLALFAGGYIPTIDVPLWVKLTAAVGIGLGTLVGGWKVVRTLGMRVLHLKPVHGFAAETSASLVLITATALGPRPAPRIQSRVPFWVSVRARASKRFDGE